MYIYLQVVPLLEGEDQFQLKLPTFSVSGSLLTLYRVWCS